MLKQYSQRMRSIHASHTDISHLFYSIHCTKRHYIDPVAYSAGVVNVICKRFRQWLVNRVIQMLGVTSINDKSTFNADTQGRNAKDHLFVNSDNELSIANDWSCYLS